MNGIVTFALAAALVVGACGSNAASPDASPGDPTLAAIRSDIFNGTCALGSCHAAPTLAAKLDLLDNGVCHSLVSHTSCLFPNKVLVIPGKPEASFLIDKLRGTALDGTPDPTCATSNQRMPFGQPPLPESKIAQIEGWIRAGANCGGDVPIDAGASIDGGANESLADVASISAVATMIHTGEQTQVTVTLTHGAPSAGETLIVDIDDSTILDVPNLIQVGSGISSVTFAVTGKLVGSATITASAGATSQSITITVISATVSNDKQPAAQLAGVLPAHRRLVMRSQPKISNNGNPAYGNSVDLSPTLVGDSLASTSFPIDVVFHGQPPLAGLRGVVGLAATSRCPSTAASGHRVTQTGVTTWGYQATPTSGNCTL